VLANGNSFTLNDGNSMAVASPGELAGDGSRPAGASWLFAVHVWRCR